MRCPSFREMAERPENPEEIRKLATLVRWQKGPIILKGKEYWISRFGHEWHENPGGKRNQDYLPGGEFKNKMKI